MAILSAPVMAIPKSQQIYALDADSTIGEGRGVGPSPSEAPVSQLARDFSRFDAAGLVLGRA